MSFPRYPAYKDSGVEWIGRVPEHWCVDRLKRNLSLLTEKSDSKNNPVALENIEGWSGRFVASETEFEGDGVGFNTGDILFGKLRPYLAKVLLAPWPGEAVGDFHVLRAKQGVSPRFAQYLMLTRSFIEIVDGSTFGSKMPRAGWEFVGGMALPIPPFDEQKCIVGFLDRETAKIDTLVAEQEQLITLLKEKRQAVISHAVTKGLDPSVPMKDSGVEWLGEVPEHWETRTVAKASTKITNGFVGPTRDILFDEGIPYIQATHIKNGKIRFGQDYFVKEDWSLEHKKSILSAGDVLIVQTGAGTGDIGLVSDSEAGFNCHALIIIASDPLVLRGGYLAAMLTSTYGRSKLTSIQTGAMHPHLNCGEVKFVELPLPPLQEQAAIESYVGSATQSFDELIDEAVLSIELLRERRSALISAAVTGQIDVRGLAAAKEAA